MTMVLSITWSDSDHNNYFETPIYFKNLEIILFGNQQGINPMVFSATMDDYKNKKLFTNTKISPETLILNTKFARDSPNGPL